MYERLKASEVGQIECQTCEKKIYVVKNILGTIFLKFFSLNLILIYILNCFYHFQPVSYYKKCAYLKEVIRRDSDQCGSAVSAQRSVVHQMYILYLNNAGCSLSKHLILHQLTHCISSRLFIFSTRIFLLPSFFH